MVNLKIIISLPMLLVLFSCTSLEYKRAESDGDKLDGAFGYLEKEVKPGVWILEVGRGGLNNLGVIIDYYDRRANEICQDGYIGDFNIIPSSAAYFETIRCLRRFCYRQPIVSGVIKCASGNEADKSNINKRPLYLKHKTSEDLEYKEPEASGFSKISTIQGYSERESVTMWRSYIVGLIDNRDVSYVLKSPTETKIPVEAGSHSLIIAAQFNNENMGRCPCIAYVKVNVIIKEKTNYVVNGELDGQKYNIWVEEESSGKRITPKYSARYY